MTALPADLRHSVRLLMRAPGFALSVTMILAIGIGANSALFTVLDRTVIRPLAYPHPERLAMLWEDFSAFAVPKSRVSPGTLVDLQKRSQTFEQIAAYAGPRDLDLSGGGPPEEVLGQSVTSNLLSMLGVQPMLGRTFTAEEDAPGAKAVVLSYRLWQRRFGGDPKLVGQTIRMSAEKYTVVGVMPKGFQYPDQQTEFWIPLGLSPQLWSHRNSHFLRVIGRLKPGRGIEQGQADMSRVARELAREFPNTNARIGITVLPLKDELLGERREAFIILLCAAACVLLIACANVGNLMLARSAARQREVAVRSALGASPARLLRQILTENLVLAMAGGALGLLFAKWGMAGLASMIPAGLAGVVDLSLDTRTITFTASISILTGVLFGLAPALQLSKASLSDVLKSAGRVSVSQGGGRLRDVLVVAEMAIALVLVIGAMLLIQTLVRLRAVDPGFRADRMLTAQINASDTKYEDAGIRQRFYNRIIEKVAAIPGVKSAGLTSDLPYTSRGNTMSLMVEGREADRGLGVDALFRLVSAGYLETIGARLKEGRFLEARDQPDSLPVVVVNETLARRFWPDRSPLGHRIDTGTGNGRPQWMTIVGVVRDIRERGLDLESKGAVYVPFTQTTIAFFIPSEIAVLTSREPLSLSKELQQAVWAVDPERPVAGIRTMDSIVDSELANRTQVLRLLGAFAALAMLLAALGIYAVLSYVVSQRRREIGLRMAIGASRWDIMRVILSYSARLTGTGLVIGVLGALGATRLLSSLLFEVSAIDPATFTAVSAGLAMVALVASWVPVVRAAAVDPAIALRDE